MGLTNPNVALTIADILQLSDLDNAAGWIKDQDRTGYRGGLKGVLEPVMAGMNQVHMVNNCEAVTGWTESSNGILDITAAVTNVRVGTNALTMALTGPTGTGIEKLTLTHIHNTSLPGGGQEDWRDADWFGFWGFSAAFSTAGDFKFNIKNNGEWGTAVNVPAISQANVHQFLEVPIYSFNRDKVEAIRFENYNTDAETIYMDQMVRYKMSNGKGPVMGPCMLLPIKSGVTLSAGELVNFEAGVADEGASGDISILGPCVIGGTGVASGSVFCLVQYGGVAILEAAGAITEGYGVYCSANDEVTIIAIGQSDQAFAKCIDGNVGGDGDFFFALLGHKGAYEVA